MASFAFLYDSNLLASEFVEQLGAVLDAEEGADVASFDDCSDEELQRHLSQLLSLQHVLDHRDAQFCIMDSFEVVAESNPAPALRAAQEHFHSWVGLSHSLVTFNCSCVALTSAAAAGHDLAPLLADGNFLKDHAVRRSAPPVKAPSPSLPCHHHHFHATPTAPTATATSALARRPLQPSVAHSRVLTSFLTFLLSFGCPAVLRETPDQGPRRG